MKYLSVIFGVFFVSSASAASLVLLTKDKASYNAGDQAVLRARVSTRPDSPNMEFDLESKIGGRAVSVQRLSDYEFYVLTSFPTSGTYQWRVDTFLQDKRLVRDLRLSIREYEKQILIIDQALQNGPDPVEEENLIAERARFSNLKNLAEAQILAARTKIGGTSGLNIQVQ